MKRKFITLIFLWAVGAALFGDRSPFPPLFNQTFPAFEIMGRMVAEVSGFPEYLDKVLAEEGLTQPTPTTPPQFTPTAIPQPSPTATATATPTPAPTSTPTSTATATVTPQPSPTATATSTPTPAPTSTATATATPQPSPTATATATPQPTPTATALPDSEQPSGRCTDPASLGYEQDGQWVIGECATMTSIAAHLGIELRDLITANPQIADPNIIHPGQVLNLP